MERRSFLALPFAALAPAPQALPLPSVSETMWTALTVKPGTIYVCSEPEYVGSFPVRTEVMVGTALVGWCVEEWVSIGPDDL